MSFRRRGQWNLQRHWLSWHDRDLLQPTLIKNPPGIDCRLRDIHIASSRCSPDELNLTLVVQRRQIQQRQCIINTGVTINENRNHSLQV